MMKKTLPPAVHAHEHAEGGWIRDPDRVPTVIAMLLTSIEMRTDGLIWSSRCMRSVDEGEKCL